MWKSGRIRWRRFWVRRNNEQLLCVSKEVCWLLENLRRDYRSEALTICFGVPNIFRYELCLVYHLTPCDSKYRQSSDWTGRVWVCIQIQYKLDQKKLSLSLSLVIWIVYFNLNLPLSPSLNSKSVSCSCDELSQLSTNRKTCWHISQVVFKRHLEETATSSWLRASLSRNQYNWKTPNYFHQNSSQPHPWEFLLVEVYNTSSMQSFRKAVIIIISTKATIRRGGTTTLYV